MKLTYIEWPRFKDEISAFTTTRVGGVSDTPFKSLNLSFTVGDSKENVIKNRKILFKDQNLSPENVVIVHQYHSDVFSEVTQKDAGKGVNDVESGVRADGLFTTEKNLALGIFHADCVPIFIYVPSISLVGIIHAGEIGSFSKITRKAIAKIKETYKIKPTEIYAFIGPSSHFSHRIITKDRATEILNSEDKKYGIVKLINDKYNLDLPLFNFLQLRDEGVPRENIDISEYCTYENPALFFSYARENKTGRNMSFIKIK